METRLESQTGQYAPRQQERASHLTFQYNPGRGRAQTTIRMEADLLTQGVELMLVGMGTVFVFLTLLVGATTLMSRVIIRLQPEPPGAEESAEEVAAITAAITRHRRKS